MFAQGVLTSSGDTTVIPAVTGRRIVINGILLQNALAASTTILMKFGSTQFFPLTLKAEGDGFVIDYYKPEVVPYESAVVLNLSGANATNYQIRYEVI